MSFWKKLFGVKEPATTIHDAAKKGALRRVKAFLESNPDLVFAKDKDGMTPLHVAAAIGQNKVVKVLLAKKADVNASDNDGNKPLHLAASSAVAELLLESIQ